MMIAASDAWSIVRLAGTADRRRGQWRSRHIDTLKRPREREKKTDGEKGNPPALSPAGDSLDDLK
jgi:hypothetical protein